MTRSAFIVAIALIGSAQPGGAAEPVSLRVGLPMSSFSAPSPSDAAIAADVFLKAGFANSRLNYSGKIYDKDTDLIAAIRSGRTDVFVINAGLFLDYEDSLRLRPLLVATPTAEPLETLVLVSVIKKRTLGDLIDGTLLIDNSARGEIPERWISDHLLRSGSEVTAREYFSSISNVHTASRAVLPVYFGKCDAAIVSVEAYGNLCAQNPDLHKRLHIVRRSNALARTLVCMRSDYTDYRPNLFVDVLGALQNSRDGKRFLERIGTPRLLPFKEEYLLYNREMQNRLKSVDLLEGGAD